MKKCPVCKAKAVPVSKRVGTEKLEFVVMGDVTGVDLGATAQAYRIKHDKGCPRR